MDEVLDPKPYLVNNIGIKFCGNYKCVKQLYNINKILTHRNLVIVSTVAYFSMCFLYVFMQSTH